MYKLRRFPFLLLSVIGVIALFLILTRSTAQGTQAASAAVTVELTTIDDARIQGGSPNTNFGSGYLYFSTLNGHFVFTQFDLLALPSDATIDAAELQLNFTGVLTGPNTIEVGQANGAWDEISLTWNNQPGLTWGGPSQIISPNGIYSWDVTSLVSQWHSGTVPNYGFALRGNGGGLLAADSKETGGIPPTLAITYSVPPPEGPQPDLGDAPDSSNHLGLNNTAYNAGGVLGRFPTVWDVPVGQVAGPRHDNLTHEAILGDYLSREFEADSGADQDGVTNILDGGSDNADNDRGDDGWRNRNIKFFNCRKQTLTVRVSKAPTATRNTMYLNVWFDGNRDGDWADISPCVDPNGGPNQASYEWIVQDYIVDMTAVPAGGYLDFQVDTERVLNSTTGQAHWMRFTLSEERTVQPPGSGYPDGRGPHPDGALGSYQFGETEDVRQVPPPPGEDGTLIVEKRVLDANDPVAYAGSVTYEIRLRHDGGSQPIEAEIRDELPYPLHLNRQIDNNGNIFMIDVSSPSGGASPLQADVNYDFSDPTGAIKQVVDWQGTLDPNSEVILSFEVHVHPVCDPNQPTTTIHNIAQARPIGGSQITSEVTFDALCPGYTADDIRIQWDDLTNDILDLSNFEDIVTVASVHNQHPITATLAFTGELETNLPNLGTIELPGVNKITLGPNETRSVEFSVALSDLISDELTLPDEFSAVGKLNYCFVVDGPYTYNDQHPGCPDTQLYPHLVGQGDPMQITVRPNDLGDAPDSSNHFAAAMAAYPGVPAAFPTVFDPATGLPQGPKHLRPRPFHLGPQVSREAEADVGPDADPFNNIVPPANDPDNDRFDDGVNPNLWALNNCQTTTIPVRVFISPQAANWFQQQEEPAYLNAWLDANRDGDWADGFNCNDNQSMVEHIVIDFPVDVVALGAGLHIINVPTELTPWPAQFAQQPFWARVTLSEHKSNKALMFGGISYGDGRGFATPFRTGETEDYLAFPQGANDAGPDLAVQVNGEAVRMIDQSTEAFSVSAMTNVSEQVRFKIDYTNLGARSANGAVLIFELPAPLNNLNVDWLNAPGIPPANISESNTEITFELPAIAAGQEGSIVLGWNLSPTDPTQSNDYTANVQILLNDDLDSSNNQASLAISSEFGSPLVGFRVAGDQGWGKVETTCHSTVELGVLGIPGQTVTIFVDDQPVGSALLGEEPIYYELQNLSSGPHQIQAYYGTGLTLVPAVNSPRDAASGMASGLINVDPSLPINPLSLTFTDDQGHNFHPPTLNWSSNAGLTHLFLKDGATYEVSVDSCSNELNQNTKLFMDDLLLSILHDDDGDGRYTGNFTYNLPSPPTAAASAATSSTLRFNIVSGGAEQRFDLSVETLAPGIVHDSFIHQPLANATVTALGTTNSPWPDAALGQPNPQMTAADGGYSFMALGGANRLDVLLAGYQPYRSWDIPNTNGLLAQHVGLTPELPGTAVHTVYITKNGFNPAILSVASGNIIEWVNVDLDEHSTAAIDDLWTSGVLESGQSYHTRLDVSGTHSYVDNAHPLNTATIIVEGSQGNLIFLPIISR